MNRLPVVLFALLLLAPSASLAAQIYSLTNLGTLGATPGSSAVAAATALNDLGHVVGYSLDANGDERAFYWTAGGGMQSLGIIGTGESRANDINSNGVVVGETGGKAFRWTSGTGMVLIDSDHLGTATGVNASDVAVGSREDGSVRRSLLWSSINTITNPFPLTDSTGVAINNLGQFVGTSPGGSGGFYSDGTSFTSLGTFLPTDVNDQRQIVGVQGAVATLFDFDTNTTTPLGKLSPSDLVSIAVGINQAGTIVGTSVQSGAFITDTDLSLLGLTSLLHDDFADWHVLTATDINNAGQVVGVARYDGITHAVLLTPVAVPEPSTVVLALVGGVTMLVGYRMRRGQRRA